MSETAGRKCDKCGCGVSRRTTPYTFSKVNEAVLLCGPCDRKRRYSDTEDALEFVGRDSERKQIRAKRHRAALDRRKERDRGRYEEKRKALPEYIALPGLRAIREAKGLSQEEVARRVGCSQFNISQLERGKHKASRRLARALARKIPTTMAQMEQQPQGTNVKDLKGEDAA